MPFTDDTKEALQAAVALVNSAEPPDTLVDVEQLEQLLDPFGYSGRRDHDADELAQVRRLRPRLRAMMIGAPQDLVQEVNTALSQAHAMPQLVRHDGQDWHIHAVDSDQDLAVRILIETAMAMIDVIRADETSRLTVCDDDDCRGMVLDLSRNRSRRYCSTTCSNRNAQAAHRARLREAETRP